MTSSGQHILITGGGQGIGRHLVTRFLEDGHHVAVFDRDERSVAELQSLPGCQAWPCDVADAHDVDGAFDGLFATDFIPNVLINNAGVIHSEPLVNLLSRKDRAHSRGEWRRVMATDLDSVFFVTSRLVDRLLAAKKSAVVISMSSISANGNAGQSAYAAAKAGVNALTNTWAKELGPFGFRFAGIAPGFIDTSSTHSALTTTKIAELTNRIPLRRLGHVDDVFRAAEFIINNDYINGTTIELDGGLVL